jgi:hypothetical protein
MKTKQCHVPGTLFLLVAVGAIGCDGEGSTSAPLDAEEFAKAYSESPGKYKEKMLTIKGRVTRAWGPPPDEREREAVFLVSGKESFFGGDIMCEFPKSNRKPIQNLKNNDVVIIKGKCGGMGANGSILMENCSLVSK